MFLSLKSPCSLSELLFSFFNNIDHNHPHTCTHLFCFFRFGRLFFLFVPLVLTILTFEQDLMYTFEEFALSLILPVKCIVIKHWGIVLYRERVSSTTRKFSETLNSRKALINVWSIFYPFIGYSRNLAAELLPDKPPYMLLGLKLVGSEHHLTHDTDILIHIHIYVLILLSRYFLLKTNYIGKYGAPN